MSTIRRESLLSPPLLLLLLLLLLGALDRGVGAGTAAVARHKRFVAFRKGSTFFYRLNYKVNALPNTPMFAQASGFKVAWELPTGPGRRRVLGARELQEGARLPYESHGFDGEMCLLKSLCQSMEYIEERDGVLMKILNLLSGSSSGNGTTSSLLDPLVCLNYANRCPLHLIRFAGFAE